MHFAAAATAAIVLMARSALASPVASPSSSVPTVAPTSVMLGEILSEAESAAKDAELAAAGVAVDESVLAFSAGDAEGSLDKRSYLGTCGSCGIATVNGEYALECRCRNSAGAVDWTRIVLNRCLANANGQLDWRRNGGFQGSCSSYVLEGNRNFQSKCRNNAGATNWAWAKNLEERIHNWNGVLGCDV
ncbi:hypothetical protein QBC37DRAFT_393491 [Rhypophila decipiens]|uniref:Cyanovirin-N domain-containing protein n=1 Tax=Rhypophila decipiens TaxID=261697 RepID=A0AAN6XXK7_9PEZI|nr:hypothetical protein QBC37DRAFT_393491 [Rhypophila decipiens]